MDDRRLRVERTCGELGIASLYTFGSRSEEVVAWVEGGSALGPSHSDVDLGIQPADEAAWSVGRKVDAATAFEALFDVPTVDLVLLPEAPAFLAADIIRGELLWADDLDRQAREELYVLRRAADLAHFQRERIEGILDGSLRR